ncbi:Golgi membrane protein 1 [Engystomops pustulosus]|uniref:Golgi membrane protein 1 n=1 Tax=Engystomops pustulosus TaxID=76066 RepID=UPI003AFAA8AC
MGLGSGRRAMKSPPLLLAVLLACVFVLGINYWITSTRCVELQNRVMELEGRIRRAAAERGAVEMKKNEFEDMLSKQKSQIDNIQSLHNSQMQHVEQLWKIEKEKLLSNNSIQDHLIHNLKVEIADYQKRLEESKLEFKELQESQAKKSSYELTQCSNKIAEVKEQCEEKIRRLMGNAPNAVKEDEEKNAILPKIEQFVTTKLEINQKDSDAKEQEAKGAALTPEKPSATDKKEGDPLPETKEQTKKANVVDETKPSPSLEQPKIQENKKGEEEEEPILNEVNPNLPNADEEDDEPKAEDVEDTGKENDNEEVERENLINMDGQQEDEKDAKNQPEEKRLTDYNEAEANEAESETDKQKELEAKDQSVREVENDVNKLAVMQQAEEDDPRLK